MMPALTPEATSVLRAIIELEERGIPSTHAAVAKRIGKSIGAVQRQTRDHLIMRGFVRKKREGFEPLKDTEGNPYTPRPCECPTSSAVMSAIGRATEEHWREGLAKATRAERNRLARALRSHPS